MPSPQQRWIFSVYHPYEVQRAGILVIMTRDDALHMIGDLAGFLLESTDVIQLPIFGTLEPVDWMEPPVTAGEPSA